MNLTLSYTTPVIDYKYTKTFKIVPGKGLAGDEPSELPKKICDVKICGHSIGDIDLTEPLQLLNTTLPLLHELTKTQQLCLDFEMASFYIHQHDHGGKLINTFHAISPAVADTTLGKLHIIPARFYKSSPSEDNEGKKSLQKIVIDHLPVKYKDKPDSYNEVIDLPKIEESFAALNKSGFVHFKCNIIALDKVEAADKTETETGYIKITLKMSIKHYRYFWGEYIRLLPFPDFPLVGQPPKTGILLGISDEYWWADKINNASTEGWDSTFGLWDQIEDLNPILSDTANQIVLVTGEPGSGKEGFSKVLHFGAMRQRIGEGGIKTRSVANMDSEKLSALLCGRVIDGVMIPGLIAEAKGGTLFLDEFDKIKSPDFYSELLRILEAGEYVPVNSAIIEKVRDVNWIFAGAFSGLNSSKSTFDLPLDFWSRLSARVDIKNPLKLPPLNMEGDKQLSYVGALFIYFLVKEAVKASGSVDALAAKNYPLKCPADYAQKLIFTKSETKGLLDLGELFQNNVDYGRYLSCKFTSDSHSSQMIWCRYNEKYTHADCPNHRQAKNKLFSFKIDEKKPTCKCNVTFDSVRAIIKAARYGFTIMLNRSMTDNDFWEQSTDENIINVWKEVLERAANVVFNARPGRRLG